MNLLTNSILVELNISNWTAYKLDRQQSAKVVADNNATEMDAARVNKNLMAGSSLLKEITDYVARVRAWHLTQTLPWSEKGPRLLPMKHFFDYKQQLNTMENVFSTKKQTFLDAYPGLVTLAAFKLGGFFNRDEYPETHVVAKKFDFRYTFSPVPSAGHFILDTHNEAVAELSSKYQADYDRRVQEAMQDAWSRLHTTLTHIRSRMDPSPDESKTKRYHESMLTNAHELCALLTSFNVTNDPKLEQARSQLESALAGLRIDDIKESEAVRQDLRTKVDNILATHEWL